MMNAPLNRREALALASAMTLVAGTGAAQAADDPAPDPVRFGKPQPQTSIGLAAAAITHSANVSPDGRAITILFDKSMQFSLDKYPSELTKTWAAALQVPQALQKMPPSIVFMAIARGFVQKDPASRVVLMLDLGGVNRVVEFPFGGQAKVQKDWVTTLFSPLPMVSEQATTPAGGSTVTDKPLDLGYFPIAITVTIQRATTKDQAVLTIDSIDVETLTPKLTQGAQPKQPVAPTKSN